MHRPHRGINLMYCYYPLDEGWPARARDAYADQDVSFAWDYPYDDYFPYDVDGQPFEQMKDIRRHGQDVLLTLTVDCGLTDGELRRVARQLRPFGRMMIRINHECCGNWFQHNKRYTYAQVGAFFVRFAGILRQEAPNVRVIFCGGWLIDLNDNMRQLCGMTDEHPENKRFWDLRRWLLPINEPIRGMMIERNAETGVLTYTIIPVEDRKFDNSFQCYGPIPKSEVLKWSNLKQNRGWELH